MPRPLLNHTQTSKQSDKLSTMQQKSSNQQIKQVNKMEINRLLRKTRSKEYMDAVHKLDAGGHVHNQNKVNEIIEVIRNEFPEVEIHGIFLGIVSVCYLGEPYEVHTLDMAGQIIEHYKVGQVLNGGLEKARSIVLRGGYDFVEVYVDCCRCINSVGIVSVVNG